MSSMVSARAPLGWGSRFQVRASTGTASSWGTSVRAPSRRARPPMTLVSHAGRGSAMTMSPAWAGASVPLMVGMSWEASMARRAMGAATQYRAAASTVAAVAAVGQGGEPAGLTALLAGQGTGHGRHQRW